MNEQPPRPAWVGWAFLGWTALVLSVYARQLIENALQLKFSLSALLGLIR